MNQHLGEDRAFGPWRKLVERDKCGVCQGVLKLREQVAPGQTDMWPEQVPDAFHLGEARGVEAIVGQDMKSFGDGMIFNRVHALVGIRDAEIFAVSIDEVEGIIGGWRDRKEQLLDTGDRAGLEALEDQFAT